jgi:hypothetical protein
MQFRYQICFSLNVYLFDFHVRFLSGSYFSSRALLKNEIFRANPKSGWLTSYSTPPLKKDADGILYTILTIFPVLYMAYIPH